MATYSRVLGHKRTLLFVLLCLLTFFAADPSGARSYVPLWFNVIFWPIAFSVYLLFYHLEFFVLAALSHRWPSLRMPAPVLGFIALLPTVFLCEISVTYMSGGTFPYEVASQMVFYFFSVQGLETVFFRYIMPGVREEIENEQQSRHFVVGGERIDLSGLLHIEAREHHVHMTFENATSVARARLSDIVAQAQIEDGIQPHRSWWVAKDTSIKAERKDGRMILRLRDDTEVPIARTRIDNVLDWLENNVHPLQ
ncbi:MAG: LytTR family DNA-binding domain-containing protein [Marivita sp.]|uniref:LytTR family DNA-binding domain-containing protein n=1 Tax=Marivita sp. TaxID=2003365 RepID=UPI003EF4357E